MSYEELDDGLGSFDLAQLGMKVGAFGGARLLKFVQGVFITREGEEIDEMRQFISLGLVKIVQKFVAQKLVDTIIVGVHEDFPDVDKMNDEAPQEEWGTYNGKPQGPYSRVLVLKLLDAVTTDRYAFVTSSVGGSIAIGDLSAKCRIRRQLQGSHVAPIVTCRSTLFKNAYNPHGKRPDFPVVKWIELKSDRALPSKTESPKLSDGTASAPVLQEAPPIGTPVKDPTLAQEMNDELPF